AKLDVENYPMIMDPDSANDVIAAIQENFDGEEVSQRELFTTLPNMKGEDRWNGVETEDGLQSFKEIKGVILYIGSTRARFEGEYGRGSKIPLCTSADGITGIANETVENGGPGGACIDCEYSQFDASGNPPECQHKRPMYVLVPDVSPVLPVIINVPPTNFNNIKKYKAQLARFGNRLYDVETKFTLRPDKTQNQMDTSILVMETVSNIKKTDPETHKMILQFRSTLLPYMQPESVKVPDEAAA
ncbi:MAG TPA: hypothetical protein VJ946_00670, partial [Bacteroidales bacterium]|nr:hypothetical protein [Bacteroidales bacterium]